MLKTLIFDCDGVMFDSLDANRHYYNFLLSSFGYEAMDPAELEFVHIHNVTESVRHIFRHYPQQDLGEVHSFRLSQDYRPFLQYMTMEPDLVPFLDQTRGRYNLAIATNRTNTMVPLLHEFGLFEYFGRVMTAENSTRPKPFPDPLLEILAHFACTVDEAIFIGDSTVDAQTAAGCGMRLIAFKNPQLPADYHVDSFLEILALPPLQEE